MSLTKQKRHQSKKLRESCRGKECTLMLADRCSSTETTTPNHIQLKGHGGTGTKPSDLFLADGCNECHAILDGRVKSNYTAEFLELVGYRAMYKKQQFFLDAGLVKI